MVDIAFVQTIKKEFEIDEEILNSPIFVLNRRCTLKLLLCSVLFTTF